MVSCAVMQPRVFEEPAPGLRLAVIDSLLVVSLRSIPDAAGLASLSDAVRRLHMAQGKRVSLLYLVDVDAVRPPDGAMRARFERFARDAETWCASTVVVLRSPGFVGAIVRGILTGLRLAVGARAPVEFMPDVAAAHRRLTERGEITAPLGRVEQALASMRGEPAAGW